jgi:bacteriocin-like protein
MNKTDNHEKPVKKLSIADLQQVVGGVATEPHIKITVENSSGSRKASDEA